MYVPVRSWLRLGIKRLSRMFFREGFSTSPIYFCTRFQAAGVYGAKTIIIIIMRSLRGFQREACIYRISTKISALSYEISAMASGKPLLSAYVRLLVVEMSLVAPLGKSRNIFMAKSRITLQCVCARARACACVCVFIQYAVQKSS